MNLSDRNDLELWAYQRAQQIVFREGAVLMRAAQWLDKKRTADSTVLLREAIAASLLEAMALVEDCNSFSAAAE